MLAAHFQWATWPALAEQQLKKDLGNMGEVWKILITCQHHTKCRDINTDASSQSILILALYHIYYI